MKNRILPCLLVLLAPSLAAAPGRTADLPKGLQAHGYASPATAASRPQSAQDAQRPGALANLGIATAPTAHADGGVASLRSSLERARQSGNLRTVASIDRKLVKVLESTGRYRDALQALRAADDLDRKLARQERDRAVLDLQARYDQERKNRKLERLSLQARLERAEDAARGWRQRLWVTLAAAAALVAALLMMPLRGRGRPASRLGRSVARLAQRPTLDELTGVFNRRHFATLMQPYAGGDRGDVGLVMLDIDSFKRINHSLGHAAGDAVLVEVARRLQPIARSRDHVVRWGGEEFVLLLHDIAPHDLPLMARRLLDTVARWPVHVGSEQVEVSISAGCVVHPLAPGCTWEPALRLANAAMVHAKRHGRNRAVCVTTVKEPLARDVSNGDLAAAVQSGALSITEVAGPGRSAVHVGA